MLQSYIKIRLCFFFGSSAVVARFFAFLAGSILAVFIALSVWDEDVSILLIYTKSLTHSVFSYVALTHTLFQQNLQTFLVKC